MTGWGTALDRNEGKQESQKTRQLHSKTTQNNHTGVFLVKMDIFKHSIIFSINFMMQRDSIINFNSHLYVENIVHCNHMGKLTVEH